MNGARSARCTAQGCRLVVASLLLLAPLGCERRSRFAICETNDDCRAEDAGAAGVCYNLRCVECRYDADCNGGTCTTANRCETLAPSARRDDPGDAGPEPATWEGAASGCADHCDDPACAKACRKNLPPKKR